MRHGNGNEVYGNYFLGNGKPNTGGVRVINADHKIHGNYFYGLTGERFFAALPVMNGVPNSPINRYHQVKNVEIIENTFIDCHQIAFGIGADNERTADPMGVKVSKNWFYHSQPQKTIEFLSGSSGVEFSENVSNQIGYASIAGIDKSPLELQKFDNGLTGIVGAEAPELPIEKSESGPFWLQKKEEKFIADGKSRKSKTYILNQKNKTELLSAVDQFATGDTLWIEEAGNYEWNQPLSVNQDLFVYAKPGISHPQLIPGPNFKGKAFFEIHNGAELEVSGVSFVGRSQHGDISNGICAMAPQLEHYVLKVYNCRFSEFNESRYAGITAEKGTFGDTILVVGCDFKTFSGTGINLSTENGDRGRYNAEHIEIVNCNFKNIMGPAINIYRGGNDESTTGPYAWIQNCNFVNVCNRELGSVVRMIGVQQSEIYNCNFEESGKSGRVILFEDPAWAKVSIYDCNSYNSGRIQTFYSERVQRGSITGESLNLQEKVALW
jgi:poly(beta-D-mannuronate) lyase